MQNTMRNESAAAAELALKAYTLSDRDVLIDVPEGGRMVRQIAELINLTEAPEDSVCSLVIDLMHYCKREKIDWNRDIVSRARGRFNDERAESRLR